MVLLLVGVYLVVVLVAALAGLSWFLIGDVPLRLEPLELALKCAATGGVGGSLYCLRGIYLSVSVRKDWANEWVAWYLIRPLASILCGGVSFLFLRAGLLVLEAGTDENASEIGYYALAFVAGLNVDRFLSKVEDVAQAIWGIEKSRVSRPPSRDG